MFSYGYGMIRVRYGSTTVCSVSYDTVQYDNLSLICSDVFGQAAPHFHSFAVSV